jgi:hypothetical protein
MKLTVRSMISAIAIAPNAGDCTALHLPPLPGLPGRTFDM